MAYLRRNIFFHIFCFTMDTTLTKADAEARLDDWEQRLSQLYKNLAEWAAKIPFCTIKITPLSVDLYQEEMYLTGVPPRKFATVEVWYQQKLVLFFEPAGVWVMDTNGMITVLSPFGGYDLLDVAAPFAAPEWKIFHRFDTQGTPFSEEIFTSMVRRKPTTTTQGKQRRVPSQYRSSQEYWTY
jgi:hypothetical protein